MSEIVVVGGGFAGLSAASYLAKAGHKVTLLEKNNQLGGRCRSFKEEGFTFDMGPSWYWMPDVFEKYFGDFGFKASDFYRLTRLDPSYRVFYNDKSTFDIPADYDQLQGLFEDIETGSAEKLDAFLSDAKHKYQIGLGEFVYKPSLSITEFMDIRILKDAFRMDLFKSISGEIRKKFKDPKLIQLLEFPVLFLGAKPNQTPALYSLMNYADIKLGTWYPDGGMVEIPKAMSKIVHDLGVQVKLGEVVQELRTEARLIKGVKTNHSFYECDAIISSADYHHTETKLLPSNLRSYSDQYWESRVMAPSSLLFYIGTDRKIPNLLHHNLFFDADFDEHASLIYDKPSWPDNPLFYACCPSKTDATVAPEGSENIFLLVPLSAGLKDNMQEREALFDILVARLKQHTGVDIKEHIVYKRSFCVEDFKTEYNSFKGNAYGLANTLKQTALLKPRLKSKKIKNLYFAGQLTTPGPGVPPSLISGKVAAEELSKQLRRS